MKDDYHFMVIFHMNKEYVYVVKKNVKKNVVSWFHEEECDNDKCEKCSFMVISSHE